MSDRNNLTKDELIRRLGLWRTSKPLCDYERELIDEAIRQLPPEPNAPQLVTVCKWIVDTAREIPGQANEVAVTREFIGKLRQLIESRPVEPKAEGHHCPSCQCPELDQAGFPGFPVNRPTEQKAEAASNVVLHWKCWSCKEYSPQTEACCWSCGRKRDI